MSVVFFILSSVFFHQTSVDDIEDLLHDDLGLLALTFFCSDGLVDGQCDCAHVDRLVVAAEHIEGSVDGQWDDGKPDFVGKHERTTFEG